MCSSTPHLETAVSSSHNILSGSCSKALGAGTSIIAGLEQKAISVFHLRQRIKPYTTQATEGLKTAAQAADRVVLDPLVDEYSHGGSFAVFVRLVGMVRDALVGFIAGLCSTATTDDAFDIVHDRQSRHARSCTSESATLGSYILSKVDSLFYFPLVITLKSRAASVFAQDPREDKSHSYVYCLGWELGSWTSERAGRCWMYVIEKCPTTRILKQIRRVTAPEVNFTGLGECLARRFPPSIHPLLQRMSRLRQAYSCERRRSSHSNSLKQNYYTPTEQSVIKRGDTGDKLFTDREITAAAAAGKTDKTSVTSEASVALAGLHPELLIADPPTPPTL